MHPDTRTLCCANLALYEIGRSREMVEFEVDEMIRELETAQQKVLMSASLAPLKVITF